MLPESSWKWRHARRGPGFFGFGVPLHWLQLSTNFSSSGSAKRTFDPCPICPARTVWSFEECKIAWYLKALMKSHLNISHNENILKTIKTNWVSKRSSVTLCCVCCYCCCLFSAIFVMLLLAVFLLLFFLCIFCLGLQNVWNRSEVNEKKIKNSCFVVIAWGFDNRILYVCFSTL